MLSPSACFSFSSVLAVKLIKYPKTYSCILNKIIRFKQKSLSNIVSVTLLQSPNVVYPQEMSSQINRHENFLPVLLAGQTLPEL